MQILPAHHYQFSGLLTAIACLFLVVLVYRNAVNKYLRERFTLYYTALFVWSISLFICTSVYNYELSYFFCQLTHVGAILIPVFFLHFTFAYLNRMSKVEKIILIAFYCLAFFFLIINLFFRNLFFGDIVPKLSFPYFPNAGPFYTPWVVTFSLAVTVSLIILWHAMGSAIGIRKKQIRFFLLANAIGYTGGIGCFLPVYNLPFFPFPFGPYGVFLLSLVSGYAILRYRFIDLRVLFKKTILFTSLFAAIIGIFSFIVFIFQNILGSFMSINPFLISAASALAIISVYDFIRNFLVRFTDKYLFQKKEDFRKALTRMSGQIITILDLEEVGRTMLSTLEDALRVETGAILVKDESGNAFKVIDNFGFEPDENGYPIDSHLIQYLSTQDRVLNLENEEAKKDIPESVQTTLQKMGTRICLPLFIHQELIGVIVLGKKKSDEEYKKEETDYFPMLTGQAAIALSNARLYDILKNSEVDFAQQAKMAAIGTLSAGIGHEVKNPLAAIKIGVEMLKFNKKLGVYDALDKTQYEAIVMDVIERILANVGRAVGVIDRLSSFAKKPKEIKIEAINLAECLKSALSLLHQDFEHYNIIVENHLAAELPLAVADRVQMEEIFLNLLVNARHAIKENGQIKVEGVAINGQIQLSITDTGGGIPKEHLDKIFDPFFTTKDVSRNPDANAIKGTGLGLFLVREFIKKFGGRIKVESIEGKGTTFHIFLKAAAEGVKV